MADYIDRETVLKILEEHPAGTWRGYDVYSDDVRAIMRKVDEQPAADVAPVRRGHWIKRGYACGEAEFECSHCHEIEWRANETDYCPNCGARMEITDDN